MEGVDPHLGSQFCILYFGFCISYIVYVIFCILYLVFFNLLFQIFLCCEVWRELTRI